MAFDYQTTTQASSRRAELLGIALGGALGRLWLRLRRYLDRSRQHHALAELDDRLLNDIGVSRAAATREAAKSFWIY